MSVIGPWAIAFLTVPAVAPAAVKLCITLWALRGTTPEERPGIINALVGLFSTKASRNRELHGLDGSTDK